MQIAPQAGRTFLYEYDFGDSWEHDILVEKILPPEDVSGAWGYAEFVSAMRDLTHPEQASYLKWFGRPSDLEAFDFEGVNQLLRRIR
ncbi:MAG: plasmid pRiA4b ORF-3 family protein [Anaerolineae bacterium]